MFLCKGRLFQIHEYHCGHGSESHTGKTTVTTCVSMHWWHNDFEIWQKIRGCFKAFWPCRASWFKLSERTLLRKCNGLCPGMEQRLSIHDDFTLSDEKSVITIWPCAMSLRTFLEKGQSWHMSHPLIKQRAAGVCFSAQFSRNSCRSSAHGRRNPR